MSRPMWTSTDRLYLDASGRVVDAKSPTRLTLLVREGGTIPLDEAKRLGLVKAEEPAGDKAVEEPPMDKAVKAPPRTKAAKGPGKAKR
jgi:hypothetical protein